LYAPLAKSDKKYSYAEAVNLTLNCFCDFDPRMAELAEKVFVRDHMDSEIRKGKDSGAFCMTALPDMTPWVLMNFQGQIGDVMTMAHEIGHAVHSMLAEDHNIFTFHPCLPLAETASTFGEMLLTDFLLKQELSAEVRRDLIFSQVDDSYATIMRQAFFAMFEKQAHDMVQQGATVDELSAAYFENLKTQFGDSLDIGEEFRWEWVSIPHFYNVPFYVYAYSFGKLLVLSLFAQYKEEGRAFVPRYLKILAAGGTKAPADILAEAGIDMKQPAFWQGGFNVLEGMINQLGSFPGAPLKN
jgi:oligoendopeptidase F